MFALNTSILQSKERLWKFSKNNWYFLSYMHVVLVFLTLIGTVFCYRMQKKLYQDHIFVDLASKKALCRSMYKYIVIKQYNNNAHKRNLQNKHKDAYMLQQTRQVNSIVEEYVELRERLHNMSKAEHCSMLLLHTTTLQSVFMERIHFCATRITNFYGVLQAIVHRSYKHIYVHHGEANFHTNAVTKNCRYILCGY